MAKELSNNKKKELSRLVNGPIDKKESIGDKIQKKLNDKPLKRPTNDKPIHEPTKAKKKGK